MSAARPPPPRTRAADGDTAVPLGRPAAGAAALAGNLGLGLHLPPRLRGRPHLPLRWLARPRPRPGARDPARGGAAGRPGAGWPGRWLLALVSGDRRARCAAGKNL